MAGQKSLKDIAKSNPTLLGDPVSLKAETSDTSPTENDRPNQSKNSNDSEQQKDKSGQRSTPAQDIKKLAPTEHDIDQSTQHTTLQPPDKHGKSLKDVATKNVKEAEKGNKTMLGDPVSLKAETANRDPIPDDGSNEDGTGRSSATHGKGRNSKL